MIKKLMGMGLLVGAIFWAGYYTGQHPAEVAQTVRTMSEDMMKRASELGEEDLLQKEFLRAKDRFLDGKAKILNGQYAEARTKLGETLYHLQKTVTMAGAATMQMLLSSVMGKVTQLRQSLDDGRKLLPEDLHDVQEALDSLL